jgi:hypothetical protein
MKNRGKAYTTLILGFPFLKQEEESNNGARLVFPVALLSTS